MENKILWTSGFINERILAPISPLGWSHIGPLVEELALRDPLRFLGYPDAEKIPLTRLWRGRPYANALAFHIFYKVFSDFFLPDDAHRYFRDGDVSARKTAPYPPSIFSPRFLIAIVRAFLRDWRAISPWHNYRAWAREVRDQDTRVEALRARLPALRDAEPRALFDTLREVEQLHRGVLQIHRWSLLHADLTYGLLKRIGGNEIAARAVAGVPNKTLEVNAALRELPRDQFLAQHGHRSFSIDIAAPTFADDPAQIERLLAQVSDSPAHASKKIAPRGFWRRAMFDTVLPLAREYLALREDQRYAWQKILALARQIYLLLADRLIAQNVIAERAAIFYTTHRELENYFAEQISHDELARAIATRRAEWREYAREFIESPTASYPAFLRGDTPTAQAVTPNANEWRGRATSPGIARGTARIVRSADELARVQRGDILIAPATDPGWTPVFARIAGLIVERGGMLSHSAVVAREYRVPAVAAIPGIVDAIHDGEMVEVDGNAGVVKRPVRF